MTQFSVTDQQRDVNAPYMFDSLYTPTIYGGSTNEWYGASNPISIRTDQSGGTGAAYQERVVVATGDVVNNVANTNITTHSQRLIITRDVVAAKESLVYHQTTAVGVEWLAGMLSGLQNYEIYDNTNAQQRLNIVPLGDFDIIGGRLDMNTNNIESTGDIYPTAPDAENLGSTALEWNNIYIGTGKAYFYTDQAESISSDGTNLVFEVGASDELKLNATELYPHAASGLNLGSASREFQHAYIANTIYLFTDQNESIRSDGNSIVWAVGGGDIMNLTTTALAAAGIDLGDVANQWDDIWIDGSAYLDTVVIEVALDVESIDINATGLGSVTAVVPVTAEGGTCYIALYDGYS